MADSTFINSRTLLPGVLTGLALLVFSPAHAEEKAKHGFPDHTVLGHQELVLNGTATRGVFGIQVYTAGLYVSKATGDAGEIMTRNNDPKRLRIVMLRVVPEQKFAAAVQESIARNFSEAEKERFARDFEVFFKCFSEGADLVKGSEVCLDYLPSQGTIVSVAGRNLAVIPGRDFYHALLRLWIGKPLQSSIKTGLLSLK